MTQTDRIFLQKVAQFATIVIKELRDLRQQVKAGMQKEAAEQEDQFRYEVALKKAAKVLYDTDFITDESERQKFLKLAAEDPSYVVGVLEKVCNAADVSLIGKPARVAANTKAAHDPVYARAFGKTAGYNEILDL